MWILFAFVLAAALIWLIAPLAGAAQTEASPAGGGRRADSGADAEKAEYEAEISLIMRDQARQTLSTADADVMRARAGRRLLNEDQKDHSQSISAASRRLFALALCVTVPLLVLGFYLVLGSPGVESLPHRQLRATLSASSDLEALVNAAEKRLMTNPQDERGWAALAPAYVQLGHFTEARHAYERALSLDPNSAALNAGFGEMLILETDGIVGAEAENYLKKALVINPRHSMARYYLGLAKAQDGDAKAALVVWEELLSDINAAGKEDAVFRDRLVEAIADLRRRTNLP